jgi:phosphoglycolate phosphatase-like HAD superfamily hydrolase
LARSDYPSRTECLDHFCSPWGAVAGCLFNFVQTLLLWDIDGTLIASGGAGMFALQTGLHQALGIEGSLDDIDFAGRTDRWIVRRIFEKFSVPYSEENFTRLIDGYIAALPTTLLNPRARVLPGVREILAQADARDDVAQGLLTGNLRRGAQTKLGHHGLWEFFPFGGFADDGEMRNEISPHALRRANEHAKVTFSPERVWVIGDTPHDIECGRVIGARTLAVATGSHTVAQLAARQPDAVLPDLADVAEFWRIIASVS